MADNNYKFNLNGEVNEEFDANPTSSDGLSLESGDTFGEATNNTKKASKFSKLFAKKEKSAVEGESFTVRMKKLGSVMKRKQLALTSAAFAVVFGLIGFLGYTTYQGKQDAMALGTEMKLDLFNGLDEFSDDLLNGDIEDLMKFAMQIMDKTLADNNITLTDDERAKLEKQLRDNIQALLDQGVLEFDENGKLTDTSKAYLVNTIVNTLLNAFPNLDLNSVLGNNTTSTTDYKRVLDLQDAIDQIGGMNQDIINAGDQINELLKLIYGDDYESIDTKTLKDFLDIMQTLVNTEQWQKISEIVEGNNEYVTEEQVQQILNEFKTINGEQTDYTEKFQSIMEKIEKIIGGMEEGEVGNIKELVEKYNTINEMLRELEAKNEAINNYINNIEGNNEEIINKLNLQFGDIIKKSVENITNEESKVWKDFKKEYNEYVTNNNSNIEELKNSLFEEVNNLNNETVNVIDENLKLTTERYEQFSQVTNKNYNTLSKYLSYMNSYLNKSLAHLEGDTNTRISEIEAYVDRYLRNAGNTEVQTIEPDSGYMFEFRKDGSNYICVIDGNDFDKAEDGSNKLEGAFIADVYYTDPYYNLAPSYSLDAQAGTLTIVSPTVPTDGKVGITSIVISRKVQNEIDWTDLDATTIITLAAEIKENLDEKDPTNKISTVDISVELEKASKKGYDELVKTITEYLAMDTTSTDYNETEYIKMPDYNHVVALDEHVHKIYADDGSYFTEEHQFDPHGECAVCGYKKGEAVSKEVKDYTAPSN